MPRRSSRSYDHRIKEQIIRSGDPGLFPELEIPRSTAASWNRRGVGEVVSLDEGDGGGEAGLLLDAPAANGGTASPSWSSGWRC
jgi:hypothetical protein